MNKRAINQLPIALIGHSVFLSVGQVSKIPKLIHYRVVLFHTRNNSLVDL